MMSWLRRAGVFAVAVVALAGCSTAVRGKGQAAGSQPTSSASSVPNSPDSPTSPSSSGGSSSSNTKVPLAGAIIESHRLGPALVTQDGVFHTTGDVQCSGLGAGPFPTVGRAATGVFGDNSGKLLDLGGYVTGWFNCLEIKGQKNSLGGEYGLMEAYDEAHAKTLAQAIAISTSAGSKSATLPGLPQAYVGIYPTEDGNSAVNGLVISGRMIVYANLDTGKTAGGDGRLDTVRGMVASVIKAQLKKLKTFTPTPVDKLGKLDDDPQQLDAKTLQPAGSPDWSAGGYSLQTYSDIATEAAKEVPVLKQNGMTEMYYRTGLPSGETNTQLGAVSLYQLKDSAAAKRVQTFELALAKQTDKTTTGLPLPKGKPRKGAPVVPKNITCLLSYPNGTSDFHEFRHDCWVVAGRYLAQVDLYWSAEDSTVAHTRSKDSSRVLKMVDDQLKLTPQ